MRNHRLARFLKARGRGPDVIKATGGAVCLVLLMATGCGGGGKAEEQSSVTLTMANDSTPDEAYLPLRMAMEKLSAKYDVKKDIQFNGTDLALQALSRGKVQFMSVPIPQAASALPKLPGLRVIGTRSNNQWTFVAKKSITHCRQLDGKRVGLFSTKGVSTAYVDMYFDEECPDIKPRNVITADSTLRRQSLVTGRLEATPLQASDAVQVLEKHGDEFHELSPFAKKLPHIGRDVILTNETTLREHPQAVQDFLNAQVQAIRSLYANPEKAVTQTKKLLKDAVPANAEEVANYFIEHELFCANGGLNDSNIADSLKTFGEEGFSPPSVTAKELVDKKAMKKVLADIGTSKVTKC